VCAIVVALVASMTPAARPVTAPSALAGGMPPYYVTLSPHAEQDDGQPFSDLLASVRESGTGRVTGSIIVPSVNDRRGPLDVYVAAAADDRMFVIAAVEQNFTITHGIVPAYFFYRLTIGANGRLTFAANGMLTGFTTLPAYRIDQAAVGFSSNIALSPDGTELALPLAYQTAGYLARSGMEVVNLSTGATRTWTTPSATDYSPGGPTWINDRTLVFPWWHDSLQTPTGGSTIAGIRQLDTAAPGSDLLAARLTTFPAPIDALSALVTADGRYLVTAACPGETSAGFTRPQPASVIEYSAADGRLDRLLGTQIAKPGRPGPYFCDVYSVARNGTDVLAQLGGFGRIDGQVFTALPALASGLASNLPLTVAAAW
jgi:hypothetical protein